MRRDLRELGKRGERKAEEHFRLKGFEVVGRNYRKLTGEIDLVLYKDGTFYFVEVKTRNCIFKARERIDGRKIERMRLTAEAYMAERGLEDAESRFLLAVVDGMGVEVVSLDEGLL